MFVARILYPVKVLGPGNRIAIWMSGCDNQCKGCSNPELWEQQFEQNISISDFIKIVKPIIENHVVDGFTITGGEPFFQPEALRELLPLLHSLNCDVLVYTGYKYEELQTDYEDILKNIAVLIDGRYDEKQNHGAKLRGSDNQRLIFLDSTLTELYGEYLEAKQGSIQNFTTKDGVISVGIHLPQYKEKLDELIKRKGLEKKPNG